MDIFEKTTQNKTLFDDTDHLSCAVENAQKVDKHTEYVLSIQRGPNKENKWSVSRRYRDFAGLHSSLQQANVDLPLPPKKLIGNMQPSFIAERQLALQNYINEILRHPILQLSFQVRSFLDPVNYEISMSEQALQSVSIALRGDGQYELKRPLPYIGWRIRKNYYLVTETDSRTDYMLQWINYGPNRYLNNKDLQASFKSIQNLTHPHVDQILRIRSLEKGAYVVRRIHESGTIRDMLYGTEYSKSYLEKYANPRIRKPFTIGQIVHYGYQILQAMKFLQEKGIPHGHIHPGNITIENQRVLLLDIENLLLGVSNLYRRYILELRHISTVEAVDVYCFGRTLYEMTFATPMVDSFCDYFPHEIPEDLESLLRTCLSSTARKQAASMTVNDLLYHPLFTRRVMNGLTPSADARGHLKFPITLKDELKNMVSAFETKLKNEQQLVRSAKRELRIQEILNSEEELKKQKRKAKKRQSAWKSNSSLAETIRSRSVSTASSPLPSQIICAKDDATNGSSPAARAQSATSPPDNRSALLDAICSFDKKRLARVSTAVNGTTAA